RLAFGYQRLRPSPADVDGVCEHRRIAVVLTHGEREPVSRPRDGVECGLAIARQERVAYDVAVPDPLDVLARRPADSGLQRDRACMRNRLPHLIAMATDVGREVELRTLRSPRADVDTTRLQSRDNCRLRQLRGVHDSGRRA